ncbi:MAG: hypothetical protein JNM56_25825 [Planctomycetia bacterium]|nr:hypothetical protein [Planctomycetia bacterium]
MHRTVLAAGALLVLTAPLFGLVIAAAPIPDRIALADAVVVGKIVSIEDKTVAAKRYPGDPSKAEFKVALIQIDAPLYGAKGLTRIRLGFVPPEAPINPKPGRPVIGGGINRFPQLNHAVDQEACFFLKKHGEADFMVAQNYFDVIDKKTAGFDKEVAQVKQCAKLLEDPAASLRSKNADERLLTAAMMLTRYRTPPQGVQNPKTEPLSAEQSKLLLDALATADWTRRLDGSQVSPQMVFFRLNLTPKDGWTQPKNGQEIPAAAQKWLKDNAGKYQVQRFVR